MALNTVSHTKNVPLNGKQGVCCAHEILCDVTSCSIVMGTYLCMVMGICLFIVTGIYICVWLFVGNVNFSICSVSTVGKSTWTSGIQKLGGCSAAMVWNPIGRTELPLNYTRWATDEPNCGSAPGYCIMIMQEKSCHWNDEICTEKTCPLCEFDPFSLN